MKRIGYILLVGLSLTFAQCTQEKNGVQAIAVSQNDEIKLYKAEVVPYEENQGYLLKNQDAKQGVRHMKITNQAQFDALFDSNQTEELKEIDFAKSFVLAMVGIPSTLETAFSIVSLKEKADFIELTYCLDEEEKELSTAVYPYTILVLDKKFNKDVHFLIE